MTGAIRDDAAPALLAVKLFAQFSAAAPGSSARSAAVARVDSLVEAAEAAASAVSSASAPASSAVAASAPLVLAIAAGMYLQEGHSERALRAVRSGATLELLAIAVHVYLNLDRPDLAESALRTLQERDDESALYQLSAAATYVTLGGEKAKEAVLIYRDVLERYGEGAGPAAVNGLATSLIAAKRYGDADKILSEAGEKDPSHPDTLINSIAVAQHLGKAAAATDALATLRTVAPHHPYVEALTIAEGQFDRVAASYALA